MLRQKARILNLKLFLFLLSLVVPPLVFAESPLVTIERAMTPIPVVGSASAGPLQPDSSYTGTLDMTSTSSTVSFSSSGYAGFTLRYNRTTETGTITVDASPDGTNWTTLIPLCPSSNGSYYADCSTSLANGVLTVTNGYLYHYSIAGYETVRLKVSGAGAGAALPYVVSLSAQSNMTTVAGVFPGTDPRSLGKAEDAPHASGDVGVLGLAVRNEGQSALSGTEGDNTPLGVSRTGILYVGPSADGSAFNSIKVEDSASASGDGVTAVACRANTAATSVTIGSDGDYGVPACTTTGALQIVGIGQALGKATDRLEDDVYTSGDGMVVVGGVAVDTVTSVVSGGSDTATFVHDRGGRTITTLAPQAETWKACSSAVTNTSDAQIKAGVASNFLYVTSYTCNNNSAVGSILTFKSNTTAIWSDYVSSNTLSANTIRMTFPVPLRLESAEALNFAMTTTATSTICCAAGYQSVV